MKIRCSMKTYIQPFERRLAIEELSAFSRNRISPVAGDWNSAILFEAEPLVPLAILKSSLAYWESVDGKGLTLQVLKEATSNVVRNGIDLEELSRLLPFNGSVPLPNRRSLRYGVHGIHEYRGKFFPQLVVSLMNIARIRREAIVLDPMTGSGTTVVEAVSAQHCAYGLDLNPLSVFLGRTKCELLSVHPGELRDAYQQVRTELLSVNKANQYSHLSTLPKEDVEYLKAWFDADVLCTLDGIMASIGRVKRKPIRDLMLVSLSNILRSVSWQKEDDLRVRKEVRLDVEIDAVKEFLEELGRSVRAVLALRYQQRDAALGSFDVAEGDARNLLGVWPKLRGRVDLIVTSPPYATALPYLDTDRLSLSYLGLLSRPQHRAKDYDMIGNREVTDRRRKDYLDQFERQGNIFPESIRSLIAQIEALNANANVGFRRRNLPALLAKYFGDMRSVLKQMYEALRPNAFAFIVVGNNHTIAGGKRVDIATAGLLADTARTIGFDVAPSLSMEMLVSRDIFRNNATASEEILALRRPS
jgi:DNA modification methylase